MQALLKRHLRAEFSLNGRRTSDEAARGRRLRDQCQIPRNKSQHLAESIEERLSYMEAARQCSEKRLGNLNNWKNIVQAMHTRPRGPPHPSASTVPPHLPHCGSVPRSRFRPPCAEDPAAEVRRVGGRRPVRL